MNENNINENQNEKTVKRNNLYISYYKDHYNYDLEMSSEDSFELIDEYVAQPIFSYILTTFFVAKLTSTRAIVEYWTLENMNNALVDGLFYISHDKGLQLINMANQALTVANEEDAKMILVKLAKELEDLLFSSCQKVVQIYERIAI
ncbi:MAG: hypothetical protein QW478_11265 [Candidatus Micrarchaeaceae archaeon]